MDKNKKALLTWYLTFGVIATYFFVLGYSCGNRKAKKIGHVFAFSIPESFTKDDVDYYLDEAIELLKSKNYNVTDAELKQIAVQAGYKTIASQNLCNELFQTGDD